MKVKLKYNAPVTLTFSLLCVIVLLIDIYFIDGFIEQLFMAPGRITMDWRIKTNYIRLLTHILGHANWEHLLSNLTLILLLGPSLEEKYSSPSLFFMILITALVIGVINALFLPSGLLGASSIVFMMITLNSFANVREGEIPLSFIFIILLYMAREFIGVFQKDSISQIAHFTGALLGGFFGFSHLKRKERRERKQREREERESGENKDQRR